MQVLNAREKERRQEVTHPVARTRWARGEVSDDDEGDDDDDDAIRVGAGGAARGAEAQTEPRHDVQAAARRRKPWEGGCQQLPAETEVND